MMTLDLDRHSYHVVWADGTVAHFTSLPCALMSVWLRWQDGMYVQCDDWPNVLAGEDLRNAASREYLAATMT